jgi:hypothetical protein
MPPQKNEFQKTRKGDVAKTAKLRKQAPILSALGAG